MAKIRMGMIGGGENAFIGAVHRMAAAMDAEVELVCGAFSADAERSRRSGAALLLPPARVYADYPAMLRAEAKLPTDQRMQFVTIVTPNNTHYPIASAALSAGFHVLSDKPATLSLTEAEQLRDQVDETGLIYGITYTYTGYPMVKEARQRILAGELGSLRKVMVEYAQGWLASKAEASGNKQAQWRLDPTQAGISSCMADIGVHAANLAEYVTGQEISQLCADLSSFVDGRELDDDGTMLLRFTDGARGMLSASQIAIGEGNALVIRVYGDRGSLEWRQEEPNCLCINYADQPTQILHRGAPYLSGSAGQNSRLPTGHPEGYIEAFANIYRAFAARVRAHSEGGPVGELAQDCPGIDEAVRGMAFIELVVSASASDTKWHDFPASDNRGGIQS